MSLTLAREVAYDAFVQVMKHKRKPEDVLEEAFREHKQDLRRLDRNFIKELLYGSLRWNSKLYWILQHTSRRNLDETTGQIQAALVMGTYQIYYMDRVPERAAVNESVEYVRSKGQASACSFVNGILRQIARRAEYFAKPDKQKQPTEYLALQFAHPKWIVDRWYERFNFERMEKILAANNQPPPSSIRTNTLKIPVEDVHELQQELLRAEKTHSEKRPLRVCLRLKEFPRFDDESLFGEGYYTVQDEAAQLIGYLVDPKEGDVIVDACCGPGGKLSHIYELGLGKIKLIGLDRSEDRLEKAKQTMARLGHVEGVEYAVTDFMQWSCSTPPDRILLDAPCSGLGVLRRHPEGKWQKTPEVVTSLVSTQRDMIAKAIDILKPGGELIYAVCSFEPEESSNHADWAIKKFGERVEIVSPVHRLPDYYKKYVTRDNVLMVYAGNQDDMDGFGAFVLRKKK